MQQNIQLQKENQFGKRKIPGTVELEMQASIHPKPSLLEQAAEMGKGEKEEQSCPA